MEQIIQMIINGVVLGSNLVMVAMGFSMLIGIMRLIQFAHGCMYMLGGYGVWYLSVQLGLNYWIALVLSIIIVTTFGLVLERYFLRQFRESLLPAVVVTVAWMMILETGALLIFGTESKSIPTVFALHRARKYLGNSRKISLIITGGVGGITKTGNSRLRKLLIESGWHYRHYLPSKRLTMRRRGQSLETISYADKAGHRLNKKYTKMIARGKIAQKTVTAVARELSGFIWGMMVGKITI